MLPLRWLNKGRQKTNTGEDVERVEPSYAAVGVIKMLQVFLKNSLAVPQKVIHRVLIQPSNSTPKYTPKRTKDIGSQVFTAALFITARMWKQPKCPLANEWINKRWCIHTKEYYSPLKKMKYGSMLQHG